MAWESAHKQLMRRAMGRFATGVAVVTAAEGAELHGMTVNSLTSVSLEPPSLLVSLMSDARTTKAILATKRFNVSILSREGAQICHHFAVQGADHYGEGLEYELDSFGVPVLGQSLVNMQCEVDGTHPHADHLIVVGAVLSVREAEGEIEPLVYFGGGLHGMVPDLEAAPIELPSGQPVEWAASALSW